MIDIPEIFHLLTKALDFFASFCKTIGLGIGKILLFDLAEDPLETTDVAVSHPEEVRKLMAHLYDPSHPAG